jgi:hypothetical protein
MNKRLSDKSKKQIKIIKPSLTTHTKLIGNLYYTLIDTIFNDIMNDIEITEKEKEIIKQKTLSIIKVENKILNKIKNTLK